MNKKTSVGKDVEKLIRQKCLYKYGLRMIIIRHSYLRLFKLFMNISILSMLV